MGRQRQRRQCRQRADDGADRVVHPVAGVAGVAGVTGTTEGPICTPQDFGTQEDGDSVVVHELAHQRYGDSIAVNRWQDIWLNEGLPSYAEWLWSEQEGLNTAQQIFERRYASPATSSLWQAKVADPGASNLFTAWLYTTSKPAHP